jgi:hypothetical protein
LADQIFIFSHGEWDVGDAAHWLDVMNDGARHILVIGNPSRLTVKRRGQATLVCNYKKRYNRTMQK